MTINNNRFSVYLLEKDVLEYVDYKNKYNEFDEKYGTCEYHEKDFYKQKKNFWYKKYRQNEILGRKLPKNKYLHALSHATRKRPTNTRRTS